MWWSVAQSSPILCNSMDLSQKEYWSISSSRESSQSRVQACVSCIGRWILPLFNSAQQLSCVPLFATPWITACQASLYISNSQSLLKLMSTEWVRPSNHLILWHPLLLPPLIIPSTSVFSSEPVLHITWTIGVSASTSVLPMNIHDWFPLGWAGWISWQSKGLSRVFSNTTVKKHQFFSVQLSLQSNSYIHTWLLEKNIALTRWTFVGKVMSLIFNML